MATVALNNTYRPVHESGDLGLVDGSRYILVARGNVLLVESTTAPTDDNGAMPLIGHTQRGVDRLGFEKVSGLGLYARSVLPIGGLTAVGE